MPDVSDSPEGVHPHVRVELIDGHPDGEIRMWVKQKFHVMPIAEAHALARALISISSRAELRAANQTDATPPVLSAPAPEPDNAAAA